MSIELIKILSNNDNQSLILLKGGELGGLNIKLKTKIFSQLTKWFEIVEGEVNNSVTMKEVLAIWKGTLHQLRKMRNNSAFSSSFINEGKKYILTQDGQKFKEWMARAEELCKTDPGLLRQKFMIHYYSLGYQVLLLKMRKTVDRKSIIKKINISDKDIIKNYNKINCQEFVRQIIIGDTIAYKAIPGTIRHLVARELKKGCLAGSILEAFKLKRINPDVWKVQPDDYNNLHDDEETVISTYVNAVHTMDLSKDELSIISNKDSMKFLNQVYNNQI